MNNANTESAGRLELLTFRLGDEHYGVDILKVQEIRSCEPITPIANTPPYVKGVINLRGMVVPIIDLRLRLNAGAGTFDTTTVVIILNLTAQVVGMIVDAVSDVAAVPAAAIKPPPGVAAGETAGYLAGVAPLDDRMLLLMDIERLMSAPAAGTPQAAVA